MSNLGYLIDVDGFEVNKKFLVKELAIGYLDTMQIDLICYKVGRFKDLTVPQQRHVSWVTRYIHGLRFDSKHNEYPQNDVFEHILDICVTAEKNNQLIGYKGGHYELDILKTLGYQHLGYNIEHIMCPKLEVLFEKYPEAISEQCSNHQPIVNKIRNVTIAHCPRMEIYCFMRFVSELLQDSFEQTT